MGKGKFNNLPWGGGREGGAGGYLTKRLVLIYHGERGVELEILVVSQ